MSPPPGAVNDGDLFHLRVRLAQYPHELVVEHRLHLAFQHGDENLVGQLAHAPYALLGVDIRLQRFDVPQTQLRRGKIVDAVADEVEIGVRGIDRDFVLDRFEQFAAEHVVAADAFDRRPDHRMMADNQLRARPYRLVQHLVGDVQTAQNFRNLVLRPADDETDVVVLGLIAVFLRRESAHDGERFVYRSCHLITSSISFTSLGVPASRARSNRHRASRAGLGRL